MVGDITSEWTVIGTESAPTTFLDSIRGSFPCGRTKAGDPGGANRSGVDAAGRIEAGALADFTGANLSAVIWLTIMGPLPLVFS